MSLESFHIGCGQNCWNGGRSTQPFAGEPTICLPSVMVKLQFYVLETDVSFHYHQLIIRGNILLSLTVPRFVDTHVYVSITLHIDVYVSTRLHIDVYVTTILWLYLCQCMSLIIYINFPQFFFSRIGRLIYCHLSSIPTPDLVWINQG